MRIEGGFVASVQRPKSDIEHADIVRERQALLDTPDAEVRELMSIFTARVLSVETAALVAREMTASDALQAHVREELELSEAHTAKYLSIRINRKLKSTGVIDVLSGYFILGGVPEHIRSDNGHEHVAKAVQHCIAAVAAKTYIEPGSAWGKGDIESFNGQGVFTGSVRMPHLGVQSQSNRQFWVASTGA